MKEHIINLYNLIMKSLKVGFMHIFSGSVLVKCISFFTSILVSHTLTKNEMALMSYGDNIYAYFNLALGLGVSGAIIRFCSSSSNEKRFSYLKYGFKVGIAFQCVVFVILIFVAKVANFPFPNTSELLLVMLLMPFLQFVYDYTLNFIRAEMRHKSYAFLSALSTALLLIMLIFLVEKGRVYGTVIARYVAYFISTIACLYLIYKIYKEYQTKKIEQIKLSVSEKHQFVKFAIINQAAAAFSSLISINEVFIVNNIIKDEIITANFKIASVIPQNILFVTSSVMIFLYPYFVKNSKDKQWIANATKKLLIVMSAFYIFCFVIYAFFAEFIVSLLFGEQYSTVTFLTIMLFAANAIGAAIRTPLINIFSAIGEVKFNLYATIASVFLHFIIDYALVVSLGIDGAVYGILITFIVSSLVYILKFKQIMCRK